MSAIRILPDRVANQIAAGEVVERPASIVKELVENALDAGATRIEIEFRRGGRSLIRVEDNGCGMSAQDALLALERHATSKIREATDLDRVVSFGFRGEALPSIASVSRFVLQTRDAASAHGTEILVNGGKVLHVRECGMPVGTRIVVSHLFNSVPARRKFLKSEATETGHIVHCARLYALASPDVSFTLLEDGRVVFQSPRCTSLAERVAEVFGRQSAQGLLPIAAREGDRVLEGLISPPGITRSTRHEMVTFVNRRPVESRTLSYALLESYHTLIPKGRFPVAFVFLGIDPAGVDVNVHPAKREVRFRDEPQVRGFTIRTVLAALRELPRPAATVSSSVTPVANTSAPAASPSPVNPTGSGVVAPPGPSHTQIPSVPSSAVSGSSGATTAMTPAPSRPRASPPPVAEASRVTSPAREAIAFSGWRHLGDIDGGYSIFEMRGGLIVFDRRAAAERVWFERFSTQFRAGRAASQPLLLPIPVELDSIAAAALTERLAFLRTHGFDIEPFGRDFFRIEAVPDWLEPGQAEAFLRDVLGLIRAGRIGGRDITQAHEELARTAAARLGAAALQVLPSTALETLVADLLRCTTPHTSPNGRPTFIEIAASELTRRFHKTSTASEDMLEPR